MKHKRSQISYLVNIISISRIIISFSVFICISHFLFLAFSIWAAISDFLDGFLARKLGATTKSGAYLDQVADKTFHLAFFSDLLLKGYLHAYFVAIFFTREIVIIYFRYYGWSTETSNFLGKTKTTMSYGLIIYISSIELTSHQYFDTKLIISILEISILLVGILSLVLSMKKRN